jgi:hypothetical protein
MRQSVRISLFSGAPTFLSANELYECAEADKNVGAPFLAHNASVE